jgi:hypothetical protein
MVILRVTPRVAPLPLPHHPCHLHAVLVPAASVTVGARMPGRRLTIAAIAALTGAAIWVLLGRLEARLRAHDDMLARHSERLSAQDEAWSAWRDARIGRPAHLRVVGKDSA